MVKRDHVTEYFNTWQTIATVKELHDQILAENKFTMTEMCDLFPVLNSMMSDGSITLTGQYYAKAW